VDIDMIKKLAQEELRDPTFSPNIPVIISVGHLRAEKDFPTLLKAFSIVRKNVPSRLAILGNGEEKTRIEKSIKELSLKDNVYLAGFQENPYKFIKRSAILALSSLYEGFPNVLLEAMALGIPVVSTNCPSGPAQIITDGENGLLVPVRDEHLLAKAILRILQDEDLRKRLIENGYKRVKDFLPEKIIRQYEAIFTELARVLTS
jgi:glycosyltransferase involved in cell wall biosynthesis